MCALLFSKELEMQKGNRVRKERMRAKAAISQFGTFLMLGREG
jgi:hypothetical protein